MDATTDSVERGRRMRLIDADAYIKYCEEEWIPLNYDAVNAQPTIEPEQPEIIYCKDCKYYSHKERLCNDLMGFGRHWNEDDYCSHAEREEE